MAASPVDILLFAPLAPILGVLLFWFIQLVFIESQKYLLSKIWEKHKPFCRFTNFLGILFQTLSHALGYTVTKSGISTFYISVDYGKVSPKKEKTGVFEWLSNGFLFIGPFFIPALLIFITLFFLIKGWFTLPPLEEYSFAEGLQIFGTNLYLFAQQFFNFLFTLDLFHPAHLGFLLLLVFLGMGIRPSYIGEEKKEKVDMIYDLKNIKNLIVQKPLYLLLLFLCAYLFFYLSFLFQLNWYVVLFSLFGWLSIIAIVSLLITHMLILLIKITDNIPRYQRIIPFLILPLSYILMRVMFIYIPFEFVKTASLLIMVIATGAVTFLLLNFKTNKFKTKINMSGVKKKIKDETNE